MAPRRPLFLFPALILALGSSALPVRAEDAPVQDEDSKPAPAPAPKPAKKPAKKKPAKKTFDYEKSKYKSREPSQTPTYKFNDKGEPISADAKKKASVKKKKRSEPPEAELKEGSEACGSEDNCAEKKTEADAL